MTELVWFRSYLENLLVETWLEPELATDSDGDYSCRYGTAAVWVRIEDGAPMSVRVFAHAVHDVRRSAKLLAELNDITARSRFGAVYWVGGAVVSEYSLPASAVDGDTLAGMLQMTSARADAIGPMITAVYGGHTPYPADVHEEQQGEDAA